MKIKEVTLLVNGEKNLAMTVYGENTSLKMEKNRERPH
jgi:hypothetical protein